jgi:uncharacterized repeat protein (TIGR01451 family)
VVGTDSTSDTATISGGDNPSGSIQFSITDPNGHTTSVGSPVTVSGDGTYDAPSSVSLALVGTYTWSASYSGDSLNDGAVDNGNNESVTSNPASPSIKTKASETGNGVVGTDSTSDTATISGGDNPSGSIQFSITDPNGHKTDVGSPVTVNGDGSYDAPSSVDLALVGTYTWTASYSGDSLNDGAVDNGDNESVTSIKASPSIKTKASVTGNGVVGTDSTSDTATISGGDNPTGTIQFSITDPNGHTTDVGSPVSFNGDGTYDAPSSVDLTLVGTYTWSASYSGDSLNHGAVDNGDNESVTSIKASPSIKTKASVTGDGVIGTDSTSDTATISGGEDPTGTIQFSITDPNGHTTNVGSPVTVNGDGSYDAPSSVDLTLVGTYTWSASYSGDSLNNGAVDNGDNESITATPATPSITTTQDPAGGVIGATYNDKADLEGAVSLDGKGTITWTLYPQQDCKGTPLDTETSSGISSNGVVETSTGVQLQNAGDYYWVASFSGDSNNAAVSSGCNDEKVVVRANQPTIATTQDPASGVIGATYNDKADLEGAASLDGKGTITWTLYPQQDCKGTPLDTETSSGISSNGVVETSTGVQLQNAGDYYWVASFSGDSNNASVSSGCNDEKVVVAPNQPTISTTQDPASGSAGDTFKDKATLSGSVNQDGSATITWKLYPQQDCTGTPLDTESVSVDADNTFETPTGVELKAAGTYYWVASFGGDSNNLSASSGCNDEPVTVKAAEIHIVKTADAAEVKEGQTIGFTMTVSNAGDGDAHGVKLNDTLPTNAGLSWTVDQTKTGSGWGESGCSIAAGVLTCGGADGVTVPAGTTQTASTFTVHVTSGTTPATGGDCPRTGVVDNTGTVTTSNDGSDESSASTCVQALVDLSVTKSGSPAEQTLGDGNITWTVVVTNHGPSDDSGVTVADPMPGGNTFVSASTTKGSCTGGAILNCTIGHMDAGESVTITLVTTPSVAGPQVNTVHVVGDRAETDTTNNTATAQVVVKPFTPPAPVFCVAVSRVNPKQLFVGRKTKLTIHVTQHGKAVKGVHVRITGPKIDIRTKASNHKGVITRTVKLKKAGILIFSPIASKRCNTQRVGVTNVFTPPVTG